MSVEELSFPPLFFMQSVIEKKREKTEWERGARWKCLSETQKLMRKVVFGHFDLGITDKS